MFKLRVRIPEAHTLSLCEKLEGHSQLQQILLRMRGERKLLYPSSTNLRACENFWKRLNFPGEGEDNLPQHKKERITSA